jgi:hypothetical protein
VRPITRDSGPHIQHRVREGGGLFLRQVVARVGDDAHLAAAREAVGHKAAAGRRDAVGVAFEPDRRHRDRRPCGEPPLNVVIGRVAGHEAEAVAVGVDHHIDEVGVIERAGRARKGRRVEVPARRPQAPQQLA